VRKVQRTLACGTIEEISRTENTGEHFWDRPRYIKDCNVEEEVLCLSKNMVYACIILTMVVKVLQRERCRLGVLHTAVIKRSLISIQLDT